MSSSTKYTEIYEALPLVAKVVIQAVLNGLVSGVYRILRYLETKNTVTLVIGILCLVTPIGFVFWILDLITEVTANRITILAD